MPLSPATFRFVRQSHLYFGVFIAPALLFFALTGALQTFNLHETTRGSDYKPPAWVVALGQLHKKQTLSAPAHRPPNLAGPEKADAGRVGSGATARQGDAPPRSLGTPPPSSPAQSAPSSPSPAPRPKSHLPMKIFFLLVSVGLFWSTITGIVMAYRFGRSRLVVTALLLAGIVVPIALLPF